MLLLLNVILMQAAPITQSEALRKAAEFVIKGNGGNARSMIKGVDNIGSVSATLTIAESRDAYYAINLPDNGGYVIVSGDDTMPAVLGYSESGSYDADKLPVNMRSWLEGYAEQYAYLQNHSNVKPASLTAVTGTPILPMLNTHWDQEDPFNELCQVNIIHTTCVLNRPVYIACFVNCVSEAALDKVVAVYLLTEPYYF